MSLDAKSPVPTEEITTTVEVNEEAPPPSAQTPAAGDVLNATAASLDVSDGHQADYRISIVQCNINIGLAK